MSARILWSTGFVAAAVVLSAVWQGHGQSGSLATGGEFDPFAVKPPTAEPAATSEDRDPFSAKAPPAKPTKPPKIEMAEPASAAKTRSGEEAIEKALQTSTEMSFVEAPLCDVAKFLTDYHQIPVVIDTRALEDVGLATDTPLTVELKGISLASALDLALRRLDLTWTVHAEVLLITTPDQACQLLTARVYDVADLVTFRDEDGKLWEDYKELTHTIEAIVETSSWDKVGGTGSIGGATLGTAKVINVSQTYRVHRQVGEFLERLRDIAAKHPGDGQPPLKQRPAPMQSMGGMGMGGMGGMGMGGMGGGMKGGMGGQGFF